MKFIPRLLMVDLGLGAIVWAFVPIMMGFRTDDVLLGIFTGIAMVSCAVLGIVSIVIGIMNP